MNTTYKKTKQLLDGEITLFILAASVNDVWQVRFTNPLPTGPRYVRRTTGHRSEALAVQFAMDLYDQYRQRAMLGLQSDAVTIAELVERTISAFNFHVRKTIDSFSSRYWFRFFGDLDVSALTTLRISQYIDWRIANYERDRGSGWNALDGQISLSTLRLDVGLLRSVLKKGQEYSYVVTVPNKPNIRGRDNVFHLPANRRGRGRFSRDQYKIISTDCGHVRTALNDEARWPVLTNPDAPVHPVSNPYCFRENRHSKHPDDYLSRWRLYNRAAARFATLFVSNSGTRPVELLKLKMGDIKLLLDGDGRVFTAINISSEASKVNKHRMAILANGMTAYRWLLEYQREVSFRFNIEVTDDTWLFPSHNNPDVRAQTLQHQIRHMLQRLGLHTSEHPSDSRVRVYYSLYSFRSYYAVMRLDDDQVDLYSLSRVFGASPTTIARTYDVGRGWEVRDKMIKKIDAEQTDVDLLPEDLRGHAEYFGS